ncbi:MAG: phage holin family protein [Acidimicrobiia bacterium]|nr:phage holin family protein [Acidimicrobiia bacterium]
MKAGPQEIPELVRELVDMSKEYLRQEALEPAKKLGKQAGFGLGAGALFAIAAILLTLGAFASFRRLLPDTPWWGIGARLLTVVLAGGAAGLIFWRMSSDNQ